MRLTDLEATFIGTGGSGVTGPDGQPVPRRERIGVIMNCPCGCEHMLYVPFANPLDGGPCAEVRDGKPWGWQRAGETLETLTLTPSVQRGEPCPKRWHGFITSGEAVSC